MGLVARSILSLFGANRDRPAEAPLRAELLSLERLGEEARALAARFTIDAQPRRTNRGAVQRLKRVSRSLSESYRTFLAAAHRGAFLTPAAEWLLDNFPLVATAIRDVRQSLPGGYYRELPKLAVRGRVGQARVYAMALELLSHSDNRLDREQIVRFLNCYQSVAPLTIGELWAWPSMLKLALVENLELLTTEALQSHLLRIQADDFLARHQNAGAAARAPPRAAAPTGALVRPHQPA